MYRFYINKVKNINPFAELIRVFLDDNAFETIAIDWNGADSLQLTNNSYLLNGEHSTDLDELKRQLYRHLAALTGKTSKWGTLTGVRPLKPLYQLYLDNHRDAAAAASAMADRYLISDDKLNMLMEILGYQTRHVIGPASDQVSVYVGIPFCPSRCSYCAFAADVAPSRDVIKRYLSLLLEEVQYVGANLSGIRVESLYFGGGTPTSLAPDELGLLIDTVCASFRIDPNQIECTVEAGRPDTIDHATLSMLRERGVRRISVNPQSLKDRTMELIGRRHTSEQTVQAIRLAKEYGFDVINSDVIAGLPEESLDDFRHTLNTLIDLSVQNITVHTLSVKRGSRLREADPEYYRRYGELVTQMLEYASEALHAGVYHPYYIYRQKHQIGALENIGWCLDGTHSLYNIRTMEDKQTIVGLGAGAIGKLYFPEEDRIERVANIANYTVYMDRFDEILERKKEYFGGNHGY